MKHIYGGHNVLTMSVIVKDARVRYNRGRWPKLEGNTAERIQ